MKKPKNEGFRIVESTNTIGNVITIVTAPFNGYLQHSMIENNRYEVGFSRLLENMGAFG